MLEVNDLAVWYPSRGVALRPLTMTVGDGQIALLTGRIGAGTSTALAAIGADLPAGARRQGRIVLDGVDITDCHPDDLRSTDGLRNTVALVADTEPAASLRVGDLVRLPAGPTARRGGLPAPQQIAGRLGLFGHLDQRVADASGSLRARAVLAGALASRPRLLLVDQPLALLESSWREVVCRLLREHADAGMTIVWAEHHLVHALAVADTVVELTAPTGRLPWAVAVAQPAWRWRPRTVAWTPLQQVASVLGLVAPGADKVDGLRALLAARLGGDRPEDAGYLLDGARRYPAGGPDGQPRDAGRFTIGLNEHADLLVRDDQVLHVACASAEIAAQVYAGLVRANGQVPVRPQAYRAVADVCRNHDRRHGRPKGTTWRELSAHWPSLRAGDLLARHSRGEQSLVNAVLDLAGGPVVPLLDAGQWLDGHTSDWLATACRQVLGDRVVVMVTTDAEELAAADRVIVCDGRAVVADGRAVAIAGALPYLPRLAAVCAPARLMTPDAVIASVKAAGGDLGRAS